MLATFILFGALIVANAAEQIQLIKPEFKQECLKDHKITPEEIKLINDHKPIESQEAKCYIACLAKKQFNFFESGSYNNTATILRIRELSQEDISKSKVALEAIYHCQDSIISREICEAAYQFFSCLTKIEISK